MGFCEQERLVAEGKAKLKLIQDVKTRWNSTYDMISRYLSIQADVYTVLSKLKMMDLIRMNNAIDLDLMERLCQLLKPFKDVTLVISSEKSSSISLVRPLLSQLLSATVPSPNDLPMMNQVKATIHHDLEKRYQENTDFLDLCSMLDPRVKSLPYLDSTKKAKISDDVLRLMSTMCTDTAEPISASITEGCNASTTLASLLGERYVERVRPGTSDNDNMLMLELNNYLKEVPCNMGESPLSW